MLGHIISVLALAGSIAGALGAAKFTYEDQIEYVLPRLPTIVREVGAEPG